MIGRDFRRALINNIGVQTTDVRSQYDALLQDNTIDLQRLSQICLQSHIPSAYRLLVWKLLLGVLPPIRSAWEFVERQESEQYADLSKAVPLLVSAADLSRSPAYPIVAAFLVKSNMTRRIPRDWAQSAQLAPLVMIASVFLHLTESEQEAFWLFCSFARSQNLIASLINVELHTNRQRHHVAALQSHLQAHDEALLRHLSHIGLPLDSFAVSWFASYFCDTLPVYTIDRVFDILIGGSSSILVHVGVAVLGHFKVRLMNAKSASDARALLSRVQEDADAEIIVRHAVETWGKETSAG